MAFSAVAYVNVYNEADILPYVLKHLHEQGIGVYILDNWSTDGSDEIARQFPLVGFERFPEEGPSQYYPWTAQLQRIEELACHANADWFMLHDADEIRRSPKLGESLLDGFARVNKSISNAVNFQVYHFLPTDDNYTGDPENHFKYYTQDHVDSKMRQVKAWKNRHMRVDLHSTGGHFANVPGVCVSPEKFILKHYPLRTSAQAARKVLAERVGRYDPAELAKKWHVQYRDLAASRQWIHDPSTLKLWTN